MVFRATKEARQLLSDESVIERTSRCDEYFEKLPNFVEDVDVGVREAAVEQNVGAPLAFAHQVHKEESFETTFLDFEKNFLSFFSFEVLPMLVEGFWFFGKYFFWLMVNVGSPFLAQTRYL